PPWEGFPGAASPARSARNARRTRPACVMTDFEYRGGAAVVDVGWREIAQPAVMVRVVVPREQIVADGAGVFDRAEAIRKLRPVFERAELRFRKRIVVADAGTRVTCVDAEVREQLGDELAAHRRAAVGMNRELVRADPLLRHVASIRRWARRAFSCAATIQPTT